MSRLSGPSCALTSTCNRVWGSCTENITVRVLDVDAVFGHFHGSPPRGGLTAQRTIFLGEAWLLKLPSYVADWGLFQLCIPLAGFGHLMPLA